MEVSVKVTAWPLVGVLGVKVKAATGAVTAALTEMLWLMEVEPPALLAVRETVKVPVVV